MEKSQGVNLWVLNWTLWFKMPSCKCTNSCSYIIFDKTDEIYLGDQLSGNDLSEDK